MIINRSFLNIDLGLTSTTPTGVLGNDIEESLTIDLSFSFDTVANNSLILLDVTKEVVTVTPQILSSLGLEVGDSIRFQNSVYLEGNLGSTESVICLVDSINASNNTITLATPCTALNTDSFGGVSNQYTSILTTLPTSKNLKFRFGYHEKGQVSYIDELTGNVQEWQFTEPSTVEPLGSFNWVDGSFSASFLGYVQDNGTLSPTNNLGILRYGIVNTFKISNYFPSETVSLSGYSVEISLVSDFNQNTDLKTFAIEDIETNIKPFDIGITTQNRVFLSEAITYISNDTLAGDRVNALRGDNITSFEFGIYVNQGIDDSSVLELVVTRKKDFGSFLETKEIVSKRAVAIGSVLGTSPTVNGLTFSTSKFDNNFLVVSGSYTDTLNSEDEYLIAFTYIPTNKNFTTTVFVDSNVFDRNLEISGLITLSKFDYEIDSDEYGQGVSNNLLDTIVEDPIKLHLDFTVDATKPTKINTIFVRTLAKNTVTGESFTVHEFSSLLSGDSIRTGNLYAQNMGSIVEMVEVENNGFSGNTAMHSLKIVYFAAWKDWILNNGVDDVFFDATKPNNNKNKKASNYSNLQDYKIYFEVELRVLRDSAITPYKLRSNEVTVRDYDHNPSWDIDLTIQSNTVDTNYNLILNGLNTLVATINSHPLATDENVGGEFRLEQYGNNGNISFFLTKKANLLSINPLVLSAEIRLNNVENSGQWKVSFRAHEKEGGVDECIINAGFQSYIDVFPAPNYFIQQGIINLGLNNQWLIDIPTGTHEISLAWNGSNAFLPVRYTVKRGGQIIYQSKYNHIASFGNSAFVQNSTINVIKTPLSLLVGSCNYNKIQDIKLHEVNNLGVDLQGTDYVENYTTGVNPNWFVKKINITNNAASLERIEIIREYIDINDNNFVNSTSIRVKPII